MPTETGEENRENKGRNNNSPNEKAWNIGACVVTIVVLILIIVGLCLIVVALRQTREVNESVKHLNIVGKSSLVDWQRLQQKNSIAIYQREDENIGVGNLVQNNEAGESHFYFTCVADAHVIVSINETLKAKNGTNSTQDQNNNAAFCHFPREEVDLVRRSEKFSIANSPNRTIQSIQCGKFLFKD